MDNPEMADSPPDETTAPDPTPACIECGNRPVVDGYRNALCAPCREKFIKFPIPKWVVAFGAGVLLFVIVGLVTFPGQVATGIHLKRAERAAEEKKYITARNELNTVLAATPDLKEAKLQMMIADFYNMDVAHFGRMSLELDGKEIDSKETLATVNGLISKMDDYIPSDSLRILGDRFEDFSKIPMDSLKAYVVAHDNDPFALMSYINTYIDQEDVHWCDSAIHKLLTDRPDYLPAMLSAIFISRKEGKYDSAMAFCDELLSYNQQLTYVIAARGRILMAEGKLQPGMEQAKKALALDPKDGYAIATLALGYHLNHQIGERDKIIAAALKDSLQAGYMEYVTNVVSGKEKFR